MAESQPVEGGPIHIIATDDAVRDSFLWLLQASGFEAYGHQSLHTFLRTEFPLRGCVLYTFQRSIEEELRALEFLRERRPWMSVIVLAGLIDEHDRARIIRTGAAKILNTPLKDGELENAVVCALREQARVDDSGIRKTT